jgi:hypothetical protein
MLLLLYLQSFYYVTIIEIFITFLVTLDLYLVSYLDSCVTSRRGLSISWLTGTTEFI